MPVQLIDFSKETKKETFKETASNKSACTILSIKTHSGWRSIDSPYDPVKEAFETVKKQRRRSNSAVLLGAGSGFLVQELLSAGVNDLLVLSGSAVLGEKNVRVIENYNTGKVCARIIVLNDLTDVVFSEIEQFHRGHPNAVYIEHPREIHIYPRIFNPLSVYTDSLRLPFASKKSRPTVKVMFACSGQLFENEIIKSFEARGIEVETIESLSDKTIKHDDAWNLLNKHGPDILFSTNNKGSDRCGFIPEACAHAGVRWATWFLDEPGFSVNNNELSRIQKRTAFCWDVAGIESCRNLGFNRTELLPLATDSSHFYPGSGDPDLEGRIVYVGSPSFGNEEKYFSNIMTDPESIRLAEFLEDELRQRNRLPSADDIRNALKCLGIHKDHFHRDTFSRLSAFVLYRANFKYRQEALEALADLKPIVYGDGWQGRLPDGIELRPYVDYYRDLPVIYRSDAVHLSLTHLQMRHYPNQRIFDAGACGRVVLGEKLGGWEELFGTALNDIVFSGFGQMHSKARMLSGSRDLRNDLGKEIYKQVVSKHTIAHRLDRIMEVMLGG